MRTDLRKLNPTELLILTSKISGSQTDPWPEIERILKKYQAQYTHKKIGQPTEIAQLVQRKNLYKAVVVYGGDGTVAAAIKALADMPSKLLIIPGGTGNVVAAEIGLPIEPATLLENYLEGSSETVLYDVAQAGNDMLALDMYGGWWANATGDTPRNLKKRIGSLAYGLTALRHLPTAQRETYHFSIDGKERHAKAFAAVVSNREAQAFLGVRLFRGAHRAGLLRVAFIKHRSPFRFVLWVLGRRWFGNNFGGLLRTYRGNEIIVRQAPLIALQDDTKKRLKLPLSIRGGCYQTLLVTPLRTQKDGLLGQAWLQTRLMMIRLKERLRNAVQGEPDFAYSHVAPRLYLGGQYRPRAYAQFTRWGITGIVNMRTNRTLAPPATIAILQLKTPDWRPPSIESLSEGVKFIGDHLSKGGAIYIHCRQGEGRGPTMAAAYLIQQGLSVDQALQHLRASRPFIRPNWLQVKRLKEWQAYLQEDTEAVKQN